MKTTPVNTSSPVNTTNKVLALAISSAFVMSMGSSAVNAAENPFAFKSLSSGYQVADNHADKAKDGKCGEGKCGAEKAKDGKCGEGKCGAEKTKDGKCGEGKCGADKKSESVKDPAMDKAPMEAAATNSANAEAVPVAKPKKAMKKVSKKKAMAKKRVKKTTT
jgi:uncharacterized low-complexity protein